MNNKESINVLQVKLLKGQPLANAQRSPQLPGIASIAERLNPDRKEQVPVRGKLLQPLCPHLCGPCTWMRHVKGPAYTVFVLWLKVQFYLPKPLFQHFSQVF